MKASNLDKEKIQQKIQKDPYFLNKSLGRRWIFDEFKAKCMYCGNTLEFTEKWVVEHIIPKSKNGSNDLNNLTVACLSCNSMKGSRDIEEYRKSIKPKMSKKIIKLSNDFYNALNKSYFTNNKEISIYVNEFVKLTELLLNQIEEIEITFPYDSYRKNI